MYILSHFHGLQRALGIPWVCFGTSHILSALLLCFKIQWILKIPSQHSGCQATNDNGNDSDKSTEFAVGALTIAKVFSFQHGWVTICCTHPCKPYWQRWQQAQTQKQGQTTSMPWILGLPGKPDTDRDKWMQWEWNSNVNANASSNKTVPETTLIKASLA